MSLSLSECTELCKKFKCDRKPSELKIRRKGENKTVWCTWVDDECDGSWCKYGICIDRRMTSDGKCKGLKESPEPSIGLKPIEEFTTDMEDDIPDKFHKEISGRRMS